MYPEAVLNPPDPAYWINVGNRFDVHGDLTSEAKVRVCDVVWYSVVLWSVVWCVVVCSTVWRSVVCENGAVCVAVCGVTACGVQSGVLCYGVWHGSSVVQ